MQSKLKRTDESAAVGKETELKKELQRVMKMILEDDDYGIEITVEAIRILSSLAELKLKKPVGLGMDDTVLPEKFKCARSREIMGDPVVLSSGQVICFSSLNSLLKKMSSSLSDRKEAAKELRRLTRTERSYRAAFCKFPDATSRLLSPLSESEIKVESDPDLQEDLITTVLNLSIHRDNKKLVAEDPLVIPLLVESLKFGTIETRRNAAAALFTLSDLNPNKIIIGKYDVFPPLLELLRVGHPLAMKDALSAIFSLCITSENRAKFIEAGAVKVILQNIKHGIFVDELLATLALLSTHLTAIDELGDLATIHSLLQMIRDSSSDPIKDNCVVILDNVCSKKLTLLMVIREDEIEKRTLAELAATGTTKARSTASGIIGKIHKAFSITDTN